jgi:3-oxoacyl-[acyl-carrier-protein] synthase-3
MMEIPPIGIMATAVYIPEGRISAEQIAAQTNGLWTAEAIRSKLGFVQKSCPGPNDGVQEMGVQAAKLCLQKAQIQPTDIDAIICIGDELREYPMTTSGIYIQEQIGATNAWAVDVMQKCSSFPAGMRMARALMLAEPQTRTVLICGGYRNGDMIDYTNPRVSFMYNLAPGGGAVILRRGYPHNILLGTSLISDGSLARHVLARYGGTESPITPDNALDAKQCLDVIDQESMRKILAERSHQNFMRVIQEALAEAKLSTSHIDYLAILHVKPSAHRQILDALKLSDNQTTYLSNFGHIGQFDQILSIEEGIRLNRIKDGSIIVGVGAGIGYSWGAVAIKWG